jgi:hypothetical protein
MFEERMEDMAFARKWQKEAKKAERLQKKQQNAILLKDVYNYTKVKKCKLVDPLNTEMNTAKKS